MKKRTIKRSYPRWGGETWIDDSTGATFEREPGWKPSNIPDPNYPFARKWRKLK